MAWLNIFFFHLSSINRTHRSQNKQGTVPDGIWIVVIHTKYCQPSSDHGAGIKKDEVEGLLGNMCNFEEAYCFRAL